MESLLKLKQTLTYMLEAHQQLLILARQKRAILVEGKVPELQNIISKESKWTVHILKLERQRQLEIKESFDEKGFTQYDLTMEQFIQVIDEPEEKLFLTKIIGQLRDIVQELSQLNRNNQELIQMSLSYIQYSLNILLPKEPAIGYGMKQTARSAKLLDAKI